MTGGNIESKAAGVRCIRMLVPFSDGYCRGRETWHSNFLVISARDELRLMSCAVRSTSASVIHIWRRLKENGPLGGVFPEPLPKEEQAVDFLTLPSTHDHAEPMNRSPKSGGNGRYKGSFGGSLTHEVI